MTDTEPTSSHDAVHERMRSRCGSAAASEYYFGKSLASDTAADAGNAAQPVFREIMLRVYQDQLVGPAPRFPRAMEDGIDQYLAIQAAPQATPSDVHMCSTGQKERPW